MDLPSPPSPILKRTTLSPTAPVTITSTLIDAENIICVEDKTIWSQQEKEQRDQADLTTPPPNHASTPATTSEDKETTGCSSKLPEDLDVIKEFIQHDKQDDYIPLLSAIALRKKKRMLFLPAEFNTLKIDALVYSGAYINAISERDAAKIKEHASKCIIIEAPPPPFKV